MKDNLFKLSKKFWKETGSSKPVQTRAWKKGRLNVWEACERTVDISDDSVFLFIEDLPRTAEWEDTAIYLTGEDLIHCMKSNLEPLEKPIE